MRTAQEVADSVTTDDDECQNTYAREAVKSRDAEVAKELRERILKHGLTEDWVIYELRELIKQLEDGEKVTK